MRGFTWGKAPAYFVWASWYLGHDKDSSSLSSLLFYSAQCQKNKKTLLFNPCCLFFTPHCLDRCATPMSPRTSPPPPRSSLSLTSLSSLAAPNARRLSGISSCPLLLGGVEEKNQTEWRQKKREVEEELWKKEGETRKMQTEEAAKFLF